MSIFNSFKVKDVSGKNVALKKVMQFERKTDSLQSRVLLQQR